MFRLSLRVRFRLPYLLKLFFKLLFKFYDFYDAIDFQTLRDMQRQPREVLSGASQVTIQDSEARLHGPRLPLPVVHQTLTRIHYHTESNLRLTSTSLSGKYS